ncbi:AlpA family transcriptional regulator [Ralstonia pseudosolanacearum]|uniref:helix-turn-helix transcriptional regulator n=1 Tax=Ralstonia pseudosolanacearum TaxID=1310165 RepID=UPI002674B44D|nr:AlpA family transcriptional regulator [Ralstonia pseudosolanacearum]MDO3621828.1 AlpA family transcriptional regulator [Ralstonia pseudosolanacearum]
MENQGTASPLHRLPYVCQLTGLRKSSIYSMIHAGDFPPPVRIGRRAVAWRQTDLEAWICSRRPSVALNGGDLAGGQQ